MAAQKAVLQQNAADAPDFREAASLVSMVALMDLPLAIPAGGAAVDTVERSDAHLVEHGKDTSLEVELMGTDFHVCGLETHLRAHTARLLAAAAGKIVVDSADCAIRAEVMQRIGQAEGRAKAAELAEQATHERHAGDVTETVKTLTEAHRLDPMKVVITATLRAALAMAGEHQARLNRLKVEASEELASLGQACVLAAFDPELQDEDEIYADVEEEGPDKNNAPKLGLQFRIRSLSSLHAAAAKCRISIVFSPIPEADAGWPASNTKQDRRV